MKPKAQKGKAMAKCCWPSIGCLATIRKHRRAGRDRPVIMVSSTVYGLENLLNQIYGSLNSAGWEVWMSHRGTTPVDSDLSNFDNCLQAVRDCDAFLGIIAGSYGSGKVKGGKSITHQEMEMAIKLGLKRWFLVSHEIVIARQLVRAVKKAEPDIRAKLDLSGNPILNDWRILDMYDAAVRDSKALEDRVGNWVQPFRTYDEALQYVGGQLGRPQSIFPEFTPERRKI